MPNLDDLRQKHPRFFFEQAAVTYQDETLSIDLDYRVEHWTSFRSTFTFPHLTAERYDQLDQKLLQVWAAQLGMVEGLSYWKTTCAPEWVITVPGVHVEQLEFWQKLAQQGMSEFFFIHQIDGWQPDFVKFSFAQTGEAVAALPDTQPHRPSFLIPVGGGKDSVITTEYLRAVKLPLSTFSIIIYPQTAKVLEVFWGGTPHFHQHREVGHQLDQQLITLNKNEYFDGHIPFSAMVAFTSTLAAYIYDFQFVPLSNEWGANEGNTVFLGQTINHQYSKTVEFERDFRAYLHNWLSTTIEYFSFLRPLHEIQITERFIQFPAYFPVFLSCNRGQKQGRWCGKCPKCLFVAIMLSAFLPYTQVQQIIGHDLLNDQEMKPILDELTGFSALKSLECVGTLEETRAAVAKATQQDQPLPALIAYSIQKLEKEGQSLDSLLNQAEQLLHSFAAEHFIPEQFLSYLELKKK